MSMDAVKLSRGRRDITSAVVVILKEGLRMNLLRGDSSKITCFFSESLSGTLNNLAANLTCLSVLMMPAEDESSTKRRTIGESGLVT